MASSLGKSLKRLRKALVDAIPESLFVPMVNLRSRLRGHKRKIRVEGDIILVGDGKKELAVCRRNRLWNYKRGIDQRIATLAEQYLLHRIDVPLEGAFIDCGANVGELGLHARKLGLRYIPFEPERLEANCCDLNNFAGKPLTNRFGLWSHDGQLTFYSKPDSGDSSLFEPKDFVGKTELNVRSLDSLSHELNLTKIGVLKIEAEGAEPEILRGAMSLLPVTRYVTVDCGFERGAKRESTLLPVINLMLQAGFEAVDWNPVRLTVLFRNRSLAV